MNLILKNVTQVSTNGEILEYESLFIQGHSIRYVHIPKEINTRRLMGAYLSSYQSLNNKAPKKYHVSKTKIARMNEGLTEKEDIILPTNNLN
jgi:hypothetical protein